VIFNFFRSFREEEMTIFAFLKEWDKNGSMIKGKMLDHLSLPCRKDVPYPINEIFFAIFHFKNNLSNPPNPITEGGRGD
jgi:hypothetical protein